MSKSLRKTAFALAMATALTMTAGPVLADTFSYTPIRGYAATEENAFSFNKEFVMDELACIPTATFSYSIEPGTAIAPTATAAGVKAGPTGATIADVKYTVNDQAATVTKKDESKTALKKATVDMSACSFREPGVYRYIITESGTNNGVTNDAVLKRTLDVYVENKADSITPVLEITGYVFYEGVKTDAPSKTAATASGKSEGYVNTYETYDLTFGKEVKGNFGSLDKYFKYTVVIEAEAGTVLTVDVSGADTNPHESEATTHTTAANPTSLTASANGAGQGKDGITQVFWLHDGQYITIRELPVNAIYSVTEDAEEYSQSAGIIAADNKAGVAHMDSPTGTITKDTKTGYTNTLNTVTPAGILSALTSSLPGIIALGAGAIGVGSFVFIKRNKKNNEE